MDFVLNPSDLTHMFNDHFGENDKDKGNNEPDANYAATTTIGEWFTTNDNADLEGKPMKVFPKIRNPYDGYSLENLAEEVGGKIKPEDYEAFDEDRDNTSPIIEAGKQFREELESEGYDGIVIEDEEVGGKSYVIFAPNQVKSATKNNGDFSKDNVNIYYRLKNSTFIKSGSYFSGGSEVELDKETAQSTADFIKEKRPKVVTVENVKGYKNSEALKIITDELTRQGYDWDMDVYNAADYGGYMKRERLIIRAVRDGKLPEKPKPLPESERKHGWLEAVDDLIDDLPEKESGVPKWIDERLKAEGIDYRKIDKPLYVFGQGNMT